MKLKVKIDDQTFVVEIDNLNDRPVIATVEGEAFEVWPEEAAVETPVAAAKPAPAPTPAPSRAVPTAAPASLANEAKVVIAPLPGTIIAIAVKEGVTVKVGQELLTLEAMKMKNSIRASREGKVKAIQVNIGDQVRHGQTLIEYAD